MLAEALLLGLEAAKQLDDKTNQLRFSLELLANGISYYHFSNNQNSLRQMMTLTRNN